MLKIIEIILIVIASYFFIRFIYLKLFNSAKYPDDGSERIDEEAPDKSKELKHSFFLMLLFFGLSAIVSLLARGS